MQNLHLLFTCWPVGAAIKLVTYKHQSLWHGGVDMECSRLLRAHSLWLLLWAGRADCLPFEMFQVHFPIRPHVPWPQARHRSPNHFWDGLTALHGNGLHWRVNMIDNVKRLLLMLWDLLDQKLFRSSYSRTRRSTNLYVRVNTCGLSDIFTFLRETAGPLLSTPEILHERHIP